MTQSHLSFVLGHSANRRGFTLVEMLVAVALVLLMMSLFAQVFQLAGGTITTQRGIAENDQRTRSIQNLIKSDLDKRSFRLVMPWAVGEDGSLPEVQAEKRRGYLYISENNPDSDIDDIIAFTIDTAAQTKNPDLTPNYGRASLLPGTSLQGQPNQPEADDAWTTPNGATESSAAEIVYFVRNGNLYRRVLPIRQPLPLSGADAQPTFTSPPITFMGATQTHDVDLYNINTRRNALPVPPYGNLNNSDYLAAGSQLNFWNDFDHSAFLNAPAAYLDNAVYADNPAPSAYAFFHGVDDLNNASNSTLFPLGNPRFRFGHFTDTGRPREFDNNGAFFGRFTHQETSDQDFHFPHALAGDGGLFGNPYASTNAVWQLDPTTGVFNQFAQGPRRGEDLLLVNVVTFDVKVWDHLASSSDSTPTTNDMAGRFVDLGDITLNTQGPIISGTPSPSLFAPQSRLRRSGAIDYGIYGPTSNPALNRVFDTWYPFREFDDATAPISPTNYLQYSQDGDNQNDMPPYRQLVWYPNYTNDNAYFFDQCFAINSLSTAYRKDVWAAATNYNVGDIVFPTPSFPAADAPPPPFGQQRQNGLRFFYRCVSAGTSAIAAVGEPSIANGNAWPSVAGGRILDGAAGTQVVWEAVENWRPLKAVQITVRFLDVTSDQMRQVTFVQSLVD